VRAEVLACDLADPASRDRLEADVDALGLTVEVLCNNAGYGTAGRFVRLDRAREIGMIRINCEALVDLCGRFAPAMVGRGRGAILNTVSTASFQPIPRQATYAATKALALSFTESLHQELGPLGVSVTALCPGPVKTEFVDVANIVEEVGKTPGFLWDDPKDVAESGIRGLEHNRRVVVHGTLNRATALGGQHAPRSLLLRAIDLLYPVGRD
jgi:hypothetical protein